MKSAFYRFEDGLYHPQQPATGSWNRTHQNGVAVGGLLVRTIEAAPAPVPMLTCRLTIDIMRPAPFQPVAARARVVREGPRMQTLESEIWAGDVCVARASAVRIRLAQTPPVGEAPLPLPSPEDAPERPVTSVLGAGHPMETRVVKGNPREPGPGAYWTRFNADLVAGEELPPAARAAMAADIASAPSSVLSREWSYANVDLSIYFTRAPVGEWVLIDCETVTEGNGSALVNSVLCDRTGPFGRAHQTLFVAPIARSA
ncbi:MAG: thioesterase family protein [Ignavibacteriales bacterium]